MSENLTLPFDTAPTPPTIAPSRYIAWDGNGNPVAAQDGHVVRSSWDAGLRCYNRPCDGELVACLLDMPAVEGGIQKKIACPNCGMDFADLVIAGWEGI